MTSKVRATATSLAIGLTLVLATGIATAAWYGASPRNGLIHVCIDSKRHGQVLHYLGHGTCGTGKKELTFNGRGRAGPPGAAGSQATRYDRPGIFALVLPHAATGVVIEIWGAGGGGGGATSSLEGGSGGGGGYGRFVEPLNATDVTCVIKVGAGGAAGTNETASAAATPGGQGIASNFECGAANGQIGGGFGGGVAGPNDTRASGGAGGASNPGEPPGQPGPDGAPGGSCANAHGGLASVGGGYVGFQSSGGDPGCATPPRNATPGSNGMVIVTPTFAGS